MASTACFLHHHALTTSTAARSSSSQRQVVSIKPNQVVICRAQKQSVQEEDGGAISRRLALTLLIGGAALSTKVAPADAAYGESGMAYTAIYISLILDQKFCLVSNHMLGSASVGSTFTLFDDPS